MYVRPVCACVCCAVSIKKNTAKHFMGLFFCMKSDVQDGDGGAVDMVLLGWLGGDEDFN